MNCKKYNSQVFLWSHIKESLWSHIMSAFQMGHHSAAQFPSVDKWPGDMVTVLTVCALSMSVWITCCFIPSSGIQSICLDFFQCICGLWRKKKKEYDLNELWVNLVSYKKCHLGTFSESFPRIFLCNTWGPVHRICAQVGCLRMTCGDWAPAGTFTLPAPACTRRPTASPGTLP